VDDQTKATNHRDNERSPNTLATRGTAVYCYLLTEQVHVYIRLLATTRTLHAMDSMLLYDRIYGHGVADEKMQTL